MPSPFIWRGIVAFCLLAIVVIAAYVALPYIASTRIVRDRIAWELSAWSGFRVTIEGAPQIEVWPDFRAVLTDVTLSKWTSDNTPVAQAERVEISLSAMAALRGNVVFQSASLIRPTLRVEPAEGMLLPAAPSGGRIARSIDTARIVVNANPTNPDVNQLPQDPFGSVEFHDGRIVTTIDGKDVELVTGLNGQSNWATLNGSANLTATGIWRGENISLDLSSAKPLLFFGGGVSPVTVAFKAAPANFSFDGTASLADKGYIDGQTKFSAPSLRRMLEWSGAGIAPNAAIGEVSVSSKISGDVGRMKFDNAEIVLDKNPGMGVLNLSTTEARPIVSGTLAFETLDLRSFLSAFTPLTTKNQPPDRIDAGFADKINLDLRLSAARANAGSVQLTDVAATAQVKDGLSVFDISDATAFGGSIQSSLRFDRKPEGTQVEVKLLASDVNGQAFADAAGMKRLVPSGTGTVSVILKGPGKALDSVMENADGSISASFGPGNLSGLNLPEFLKHNQDGGFFPLDDVTNGTVPISGAELKANISNGVARIEKAEATSADTRIWLSGIIPYAGRGLALSGGITPATQPAPVDGQPAPAPAQPSFFVGGTWTTPFVSPITRIQPGG